MAAWGNYCGRLRTYLLVNIPQGNCGRDNEYDKQRHHDERDLSNRAHSGDRVSLEVYGPSGKITKLFVGQKGKLSLEPGDTNASGFTGLHDLRCVEKYFQHSDILGPFSCGSVESRLDSLPG